MEGSGVKVEGGGVVYGGWGWRVGGGGDEGRWGWGCWRGSGGVGA